MRYIWRPGYKGRMHIQAHNVTGAGLNGAMCGILYRNGYRTINAPFALGRKVCLHCKAVFGGERKRPDWLH